MYNGKQGTVEQLLMSAKVNGMTVFNGVEQGSGQNCNRVYVYFNPNKISEAKEWIQKVYGKTFKVEEKKSYETSIRVLNKEEEKYNHQVNNYIVDRIKAIQIDNMDELADNRSQSNVVKGTKSSYGYSEKEDYEKADSDDETVQTNNKSWQSNESLESLTDISQKSMQKK